MTGVGAIQSKVLKKDHTNLFGFNISGHVPAYVMRPEVHLEGLDPITHQWLEIPFRYKPSLNTTISPTQLSTIRPTIRTDKTEESNKNV
jgi:hypothetical protein